MTAPASIIETALGAELWAALQSVWGLGSENGEDETIAVSEPEFMKIAARVLGDLDRARREQAETIRALARESDNLRTMLREYGAPEEAIPQALAAPDSKEGGR